MTTNVMLETSRRLTFFLLNAYERVDHIFFLMLFFESLLLLPED